MASKDQRWKTNRSKLFFLWGLGCWHALQNTWTWKKTPLVFSYYLFSLFLGVLFQFEMHSFCENLGSLCISVSWLPSNIHKLWPTIASSVGIRAKRFLAFLILETAGLHLHLQVGAALEICIQVRKISWIFVSYWKQPDQVVRWPSGQVTRWTRWSRWSRWTRRTRWSRWSGCAFKRKSHFCWMASMASPPFGKL